MSFLELESLSTAFWLQLSGTVIRSVLLAITCALLLRFSRSRAAEVRHFAWRGVLYGLLILPLLQMMEPPHRGASQILYEAERTILAGPQQYVATITRHPIMPGTSAVLNNKQSHSWLAKGFALYVLITVVLLTRLTVSLYRLKLIVRRSETILDTDFRQLAGEIWLESLSSVKPRICVSAEVHTPVALGIDEKFILLPSAWRAWDVNKLRAVLLHEMEHVRRDDPRTAFVASLATCIFWVHPLTYWLRRRLSALAEEACDKIALQAVGPEQYSRILIDFAIHRMTLSGRFVAASSFVTRRSQIKTRLERICSTLQSSPRHPRAVQMFFILAFFPILYILAATRFNQPLNSNETGSRPGLSIGTQKQAASLESDLQKHPDDLRARGALMSFYANSGDVAGFRNHMLWLIRHHPDSPLAGMRIFTKPRERFGTSENDELMKSAWNQALKTHAGSAETLFHAGLFFERAAPLQGLSLYKRAMNISQFNSDAQERYLQAIALIYSAAVIADVTSEDRRFRLKEIAMTPELAIMLRTELKYSNDASLLSQVGTTLVQISDNKESSSLGLSFLNKAITLDPGNNKWKEALESAKAEPIRRRNLREMTGWP